MQIDPVKQVDKARQRISADVQEYLSRGGSVQVLPQNHSAAQWEPIRRKKSSHIDHLKRSDPRHPVHRDGR